MTTDPTDDQTLTDPRIDLVTRTLDEVALASTEGAAPMSALREAAAELIEKLDQLSTLRPPWIETDRDAVRIVEAVLLEDDPVDPTAERIVRALLGVPTLHRRPDGTLVADWHDTPEHTPRAALVARPLLDDIVSAQSREGGDLHVARTAIDVLLDVTAGVREALADPVLGKRHASRLFDSADRILDTLRAIHPYEPPAPVEVRPLATVPNDDLVDGDLRIPLGEWVDNARRAAADRHAEVRDTLPDELVEHAAEHRPVWPDPEVAVDLIDHTDEHDGDGVIEHLSPDCKVRKCKACVGSAWSVEDDALVECTHPCHTPVPVVE